ncbi:MAG: tRNA (adenosine(37)-N6)-threonylcarbamoyltransferase complex transferase subunit TsaD [Firmicutes bacterium]|uniref:tRNA N6-adenosine threonylcarbamoyltransferase n=1 Tax=Melghirimyces thermohalophilus TaxID=1236220 RepID=A0A1G6R6I9_9BACL|nr:tRNA (adenosine(37)-N6)-threonylcarbamoyltransferase complex transferase subunit TsaD [Melghirimyces thermohalophilus]MDA8352069.1 tRNA (adenosine(37)-N6)-threonylcarbamoyltransferase complex transferase subunit TsaD [Bacillota bacterium]SDD00071.1 O-sialoglycoprotein endopeptidase [Melghirimyces thermohalophilus]
MKPNQNPLVLGIETSCDETSAAVVEKGERLLSNVISSQMKVHRRFGGVVPEVASRRHVERITDIIQQALDEAKVTLADLSAVAVTQGPGLVGALLIGVSAAKALSFSTGLPLVGVHHIAGHIYASHLVEPLQFPLVALVVSGGHTELIYMSEHNRFERLGRTRDDAAGEAFDKVARVLGLPYPGGPEIDRLARTGTPAIDLPRAWLEPDSLDFSFSGLKSAVINRLHNAKQRGEEIPAADLAASFQESVVEVLTEKAIRAVQGKEVDRLVLAGGVSANSALRKQLKARCMEEGIHLSVPPLELCTDNAGMIATAGTFQYLDGQLAGMDLNAEPNLKLT